MRPPFWHPPITCSPAEQAIITHIKRAKLFVFLRDHRHEFFDDAFRGANWRRFMPPVAVGTLPFRQRN